MLEMITMAQSVDGLTRTSITKCAEDGVLNLGNNGTGTITIVAEDGTRTDLPTGHVADVESGNGGRFRRVIRVYRVDE